MTAARDIVNFRISPEGALTVREGTRLLTTMDSSIRAVWSGIHEGRFRYYVLCSSSVYELEGSFALKRLIGNVTTTSGDAEFFYYRNCLYLVDGAQLLRVNYASLSVPLGYVPLVAKGWSDGELGEINEPRNLLNPYARYEYIISERESTILRLDSYISRVDALYINGELVSADRYTLGTYAPYINVSGLNAGDRVCAYVVYRDSVEGLTELKGATRAYVYGGVDTSRIFLYGTLHKNLVHAASFASEASIREARRVYPTADALYFAVGCDFGVGDGSAPVNALCRHYDRLLIFTSAGTWRADSSVSGHGAFPTMSINTAIGVSTAHGAAVLGNNPYTVSGDGIYVWTADTDELNDCNARRISDDIAALLPTAFYKNAVIFADRANSCVYIYSSNLSNRMAVYHEKRKAWTFFEGLCPNGFFNTENGTAFYVGSQIYTFDSSLYADSGTPINAYFNSAHFTGSSIFRKHLKGITAEYTGGPFSCQIFVGSAPSALATPYFGRAYSVPACTYRRTTIKRFNSFNIKIVSAGTQSFELYSLCMHLR